MSPPDTPGLFLALEGIEGAGKTTLAQRLSAVFQQAGHASLVVREPGGTPLGEQIRALLLHPAEPPPAPRTETLLFSAARAQLVHAVLRPALAAGQVVIADRYAASTLAYQAFGRGLPLAEVEAVVAFAIEGLWPDLTILLDLDPAVGLRRKARRSPDRFEQEPLAFHERVRQGYRWLAEASPERWLVLDATHPPETLIRQILTLIAHRWPRWAVPAAVRL